MPDKPQNPMVQLRQDLTKYTDDFRAALPQHITPDRFIRTVITQYQRTPELLDCSPASQRLAIMQAAHDGLVPDGREGALIPFNSRDGKIAQWMPMVAGIRKKARNSGMVKNLYCHAVHAKDFIAIDLGTEPKIVHRPYLEGDRGPMTLVYSVAVLEGDEINVDWMTAAQVQEVRRMSRAKSGPWFDWPIEMARKAITKRHCKQLPMSSDLDDLLRRDDEVERQGEPRDITPSRAVPQAITGDAFDAFAGNGSGAASETPPEQEPAQEVQGSPQEPEKPTRRPSKRAQADKAQAASAGPANEPQEDEPDLGAHLLARAREFTDFTDAMTWWTSNKASILQTSAETQAAIREHMTKLG